MRRSFSGQPIVAPSPVEVPSCAAMPCPSLARRITIRAVKIAAHQHEEAEHGQTDQAPAAHTLEAEDDRGQDHCRPADCMRYSKRHHACLLGSRPTVRPSQFAHSPTLAMCLLCERALRARGSCRMWLSRFFPMVTMMT